MLMLITCGFGLWHQSHISILLYFYPYKITCCEFLLFGLDHQTNPLLGNDSHNQFSLLDACIQLALSLCYLEIECLRRCVLKSQIDTIATLVYSLEILSCLVVPLFFEPWPWNRQRLYE